MFITTKDGKRIRLNEEDLQKHGWSDDACREYVFKRGLEEMLYLAKAYGNGNYDTYVEVQPMYRWSC